VAKNSQDISDLHKSLHLLAKKLNMKEYSLVTGVMFRLYMGQKFDYRDTFDPNFMVDIKEIYKNIRASKVVKKAKIFKLKVIRGGKNG
jgi:hypothetical protein|tara:strand:- start:982 stop:1245 length:264 start_codon:yes stop_codon:yes gene_type:complete